MKKITMAMVVARTFKGNVTEGSACLANLANDIDTILTDNEKNARYLAGRLVDYAGNLDSYGLRAAGDTSPLAYSAARDLEAGIAKLVPMRDHFFALFAALANRTVGDVMKEIKAEQARAATPAPDQTSDPAQHHPGGRRDNY